MDEIGRIERRIGLHDLRVLMAVVKAGSMGKAAKLLATSQSAISRSIGEFEQTLGVRLLDRSANGIEPTSYGQALVRRGTAVFDEIQQGIKDIRSISDPTAGELTIGASIAIAEGFVCSMITSLFRRHPRVSFQVHATDTATAYQDLLTRKIDLADRASYSSTQRRADECRGAIARPSCRRCRRPQSRYAPAPDQLAAVNGRALGVAVV